MAIFRNKQSRELMTATSGYGTSLATGLFVALIKTNWQDRRPPWQEKATNYGRGNIMMEIGYEELKQRGNRETNEGSGFAFQKGV